MSEQPGNLLLAETHPPSVQNEVVLFWFERMHAFFYGHLNSFRKTDKAGKVVENYRSLEISVSNLLRSRSRLRR